MGRTTSRRARRAISALVAVCLLAPLAQAQYSGGSGTAEDPYQIATAADLIALGETPDDYDKHFKLMADIDLSGYSYDRAAIAPDVNDLESGFQGTSFTGVFDGSGQTIANLTIVSGDSQPGLFGWLDVGARVTDLLIVDANITHLDTALAGMLAACNDGLVDHCYASGTIAGHVEVGGLVGRNSGSVVCCCTAGSVDAIKGVGGLVGRNKGIVDNSYSTAGVSGRVLVAGLVGDNDEGGLVSTSYSAGLVTDVPLDVAPEEPQGMGGLVGCNGGRVVNGFWDVTTSGLLTSDGGVGKTTAEMQAVSTFLNAGWDFVGETDNGTEDIWKIIEGQTYPLLSWQKYGGGTGEPNDPYLIYTAEHLNALGAEPNDYDKHFKLMADIDLSGYVYERAVIAPDTNDMEEGYQQWYQGIPFSGGFDGNGHTVSHLTIHGESFLGLFGVLGPGGEISNLGLERMDISGTGDYVGGLVGYNHGGASDFEPGCVWGLETGRLDRCFSAGTVSGDNDVGGLVGYNDGNVSGSCSSAVVSGNAVVGGLIGHNSHTVYNSYSTGEVFASDGEVGGLAGANRPMLGLCERPCLISNCYSTGVVSGGPSARLIGGLVGNCVDRLGYWGDTINSFWDTQNSGQIESAGGTGLTALEMQTAGTFLQAGWDFVCETANGTEDIWYLPEGDYPRLAWELDEAPLCPPEVIELNAASFDETIAHGVVLVDFYATWCPHCHTQAPILEEVAEQVGDRAVVAKLDIDRARSVAQTYGVTAIPTLIVFKDGEIFERFLGVTQAPVLTAAIQAAIDYQPTPSRF